MPDLTARELVAPRAAHHDHLRHRALPEHLPRADQGRGRARRRTTSRRASTPTPRPILRGAHQARPRSRRPDAAPNGALRLPCRSLLALSPAARRRHRRAAADARRGVLEARPEVSPSARAIVLFAGAVFAGGRVDVRPRASRRRGRARAVAPHRPLHALLRRSLCLGGGLAALLAGGYLPEHHLDRGEFYSLLLFATFGAMMLAAAGDALTLFLGLETMSIGAYALTAFRRSSPRSAEGALKYFLLGVVRRGDAALRLRAPLRATGHTDLAGIGAAAARRARRTARCSSSARCWCSWASSSR